MIIYGFLLNESIDPRLSILAHGPRVISQCFDGVVIGRPRPRGGNLRNVDQLCLVKHATASRWNGRCRALIPKLNSTQPEVTPFHVNVRREVLTKHFPGHWKMFVTELSSNDLWNVLYFSNKWQQCTTMLVTLELSSLLTLSFFPLFICSSKRERGVP